MLEGITLTTAVAAFIGFVAFVKAAQFMYALFFANPKKEMLQEMEKIKQDNQITLEKIEIRLKEVEDHKIASNVRHESTQRAMERMDEKMDDLSSRIDEMNRNLGDQIRIIVDLLRKP